ncbi:hypothetical protein J31TS4_18710 [Paenibacillus sp. J31TS4]|uniref:hypothetical protein n=1 Tax=Paenibacillus sp. J31TS4 TaxID=2807195 RepID=UPI001B0C7D27|nr:hypothetical protein [Paenibacillus sp. J31TS4]GIP38591.1 hypothetical protein J31TS4_18710 [Paenibacillus sp. J31TS4]
MRFVGIDPSTKTGFVALDEAGNVLREKELTGVGSADPRRMVTMIDEIMVHLQPEDVVCIEGFGFASQQAVQNGGIGWGIRMAMFRRGWKYTEIAPNTLKSFIGCTGWTGEKGNKTRLKGKAKKQEVLDAVESLYGYRHSSDNVTDAYVLAQIARAMHKRGLILPNQQEIVANILGVTKTVKKTKKTKVS